MDWLFEFLQSFPGQMLTILAILDLPLALIFIVWVLMTKSNATSAVAWCLVIIFLPYLGAILFWFFGYQHVQRRLRRKKLHRLRYQDAPNPQGYEESEKIEKPEPPVSLQGLPLAESLAKLAIRFGAYSVTRGNQIDFYDDGPPCFEAMFEAIKNARHHIHMEFFIFRKDFLGKRMIDALTAKARQGVEVRLLYDAMGSVSLPYRFLKPLHKAGGKSSVFLPLNPFRRRLQVNMRNHRKVMVIDGEIGFIGGLNVGREYLGEDPTLGYWRDTHLRIQGPAVCDLQRVFCEDWDFAADEYLADDSANQYFHVKHVGGPYAVQVIDSGPDQDTKSIREVLFAAILKARRRIWIATPYFVPDDALLDALRLAAHSGVDVRILGQSKPDRWVPWLAARYYFEATLRAGVRVLLYKKGMMHSKVLIIDDDLGTVGSANFDNRSFFLNFEANCLIYSERAVARLEESFLRDFADSVELQLEQFARRSFPERLLENACRLLSPVL